MDSRDRTKYVCMKYKHFRLFFVYIFLGVKLTCSSNGNERILQSSDRCWREVDADGLYVHRYLGVSKKGESPQIYKFVQTVQGYDNLSAQNIFFKT